jgi:putative transposase
MARPPRVEFEDAIYHLCARGNARQAVFHDDRDRARFVELLSGSAQRFGGAILCFVLMDNQSRI